MRWSSWPVHSKVLTAEVMVIPRSRSRSIQSITARPSWTSPILWVRPAAKRKRSESVVFPASMWAMIPMFRMARIRRTGAASRVASPLMSVEYTRPGRVSP